MTSRSINLKSDQTSPSTIPQLSSGRLQSLPPSAIINIFYAFSTNSYSPSQCNHAWIRPAFQFATSNSRLYLLYLQTMYNPALDSHHQHQFLTTDCQITCFTTLLSGLTALSLVRRSISPLFDAQFVLQARIPTHSSSRSTTKTFSSESSTLSITQIEQFFTVATSFPLLHSLKLSNVTSRENAHLWSPITHAWSRSLKSLSIEDTYSEFDQQCFVYFTRFRNLERLVISSRAVRWIHPLQYLTSLKELVLHNCAIQDNQVVHILSNMTHLQALDLTETCVTPNIVNSLPLSLVRFAGGDRDAHCDDQDQSVVTPGLPPVDVRQATLFEQVENSYSHWKNIVVIQHRKLPRLKHLEWGEWTSQRQSAASLRLIMPQLDSLSLYGPDYDDQLCDALINSSHLKCLELYGCNVTDISAHVISQQRALQFVSITNCERITPRGFVSICTGRAAHSETLESVLFFGHVQAPPDALSDLLDDHRDMFSDADVNHSDSDVNLDEES